MLLINVCTKYNLIHHLILTKVVNIHENNFLINILHKWIFRNMILKIQLKIQAASELRAVQVFTFKVWLDLFRLIYFSP